MKKIIIPVMLLAFVLPSYGACLQKVNKSGVVTGAACSISELQSQQAEIREAPQMGNKPQRNLRPVIINQNDELQIFNNYCYLGTCKYKKIFGGD